MIKETKKSLHTNISNTIIIPRDNSVKKIK